ncbi:hypothetical protein [Alkalicoccus saliphilus]|uniref:hypothetical protein n=1 Tax=Alkalicoccus saliphilus TaxID=200989 RepID=UPI001357BCB0|nr:hypothetical protein [Alkalicoccus saliphilus]
MLLYTSYDKAFHGVKPTVQLQWSLDNTTVKINVITVRITRRKLKILCELAMKKPHPFQVRLWLN